MWAKQGGSGGIRGKDMVQLPQADVFFAKQLPRTA